MSLRGKAIEDFTRPRFTPLLYSAAEAKTTLPSVNQSAKWNPRIIENGSRRGKYVVQAINAQDRSACILHRPLERQKTLKERPVPTQRNAEMLRGRLADGIDLAVYVA